MSSWLAYVRLAGCPSRGASPKPPALGGLTVDSTSEKMATAIGVVGAVPPGSRGLRWLVHFAHWPVGSSSGKLWFGCALLLVAHITRACWTTYFLMYFGLDKWVAGGLSAIFCALSVCLALYYHVLIFSEPHILHRLLADMDAGGDRLRRLDARATRGIVACFLVWVISSGCALTATSWMRYTEQGEFRLASDGYLLILFLADFLFGRALEHKTQFFMLYFEAIHSLLEESVKEFAKSVELILSAVQESSPADVYEQLHVAECRMRTHMKWANEVEGNALLGFLAQEVCSAIYTTGVAFFIKSPALTGILLLYSTVQLVTLLNTSLDVAKPGDMYNRACKNLDTPRTLAALDSKLNSDYFKHLYRMPTGVTILKTLITTPVMVKVVFTIALPTVFVGLQQAAHFNNKF